MGLFTIRKTLNPDKGYPCVYRNWKAASHCNLWHGYDLIFTLVLSCPEHYLTTEGWVFDFGAFGPLKDRIDQTFDHKFIVAEDDPALLWCRSGAQQDYMDLVVLPHVSVEGFARWLADEAAMILEDAGRLRVVKIVEAIVAEHGGNSGGYIP